VVVIPEGVAEDFFEPVGDEVFQRTAGFIRQGAPYFLWSGSLNPRKNLPRVVDAFERIANDVPHHLILCGGLGWDSEETLRRVKASAVARRIHLPGRVDEDELRGLYQRASAFVFASLMEGFGLPILEAMASGCPVITSNCSAMPEVAGDAAFLVDPEIVTDIADAMRCLATDTVFARHLASKGRARAVEFRWDTCAAAVAEVYRRVSRSAGSTKIISLSEEFSSSEPEACIAECLPASPRRAEGRAATPVNELSPPAQISS
jgi:glycosyltransferase involved in cell wall biosynthesis